MKVTLTSVGTALLVVLAGNAVEAQESIRLQFHPDLQWNLGSTFDVNNPFDDKVANCVVGDEKPGSTSGSSLNVRIARDEDELRNLLKIDARLDVQYGPQASGNAHFSVEHERYFRSDQVTAVVIADEAYSFSELTRPKLTPDALAKADEQLRNDCGSHFVSKLTSGSKLVVLFVASQLTNEEKQKLTAGVEVKTAVVSASVNFFEQFAKLKKEGRAQVNVFATGGGGIPAFGGIVEDLFANKTPAEIAENLGGAIGELMKSFGRQNAAPVAFTAIPLSALRPGLKVNVFLEWRYMRLKEITTRYRQAGRNLLVARAALAGERPWSALAIDHAPDPAAQRKLLEAARIRLSDYERQLATAYQECVSTIDAPKCDVPEEPALGVAIPVFPPEPSVGFRLMKNVGDTTGVCSERDLLSVPVSSRFLTDDVRQAVGSYAALNPSEDVSLVLRVSGQQLVSPARLVTYKDGVAADVVRFNIEACGGAFMLHMPNREPQGQLTEMIKALNARGTGADRMMFKVEVTDVLGRRFVSDIATVKGGSIFGMASHPACEPSASDPWQCAR